MKGKKTKIFFFILMAAGLAFFIPLQAVSAQDVHMYTGLVGSPESGKSSCGLTNVAQHSITATVNVRGGTGQILATSGQATVQSMHTLGAGGPINASAFCEFILNSGRDSVRAKQVLSNVGGEPMSIYPAH